MRNAENNEVDLLLRDLARREGAGPSYGGRVGAEGKDGSGEHLDADELNSFAEGVLPANTRSLYATHLADCSRCRKIVAQLALSSSAAVRQVAVEPSKSKLWSYIATLFTPAVMRYAIPALSLVILAAFGLIWIQQTRRSDFVARNNEAVVVAPEPGLSGALQPALTQEQTNQESAARSAAAPNPTPQAGSDSFREEEKAQAKNETVATRSSEKGQKVAEPSEVNDSVAALPSVAPTIAANAPAPAKPSGEYAVNKREEAATARQQRSAADASVQSEDERRNRNDRDAAGAKEKDDTGTTPERGSAAGRRAMVTTGSTQSADGATTRTVAGRHFRRVNNAWVDTAYESGAQVTTLARGSEQYRALIGDEPGLRSIAEQLTGEVIVVWKGRTYRIR